MTANPSTDTHRDAARTPQIDSDTVAAQPGSAYRLVKSVAMAVGCPVSRCAARPGAPCVATGQSPLPYHLGRLDAGLLAEFPDLRDAKDEQRALRRRRYGAI